MKNRIHFITMILFILALGVGCQNQNSPFSRLDPAYEEHISAYTFGVITRNSNITVTLADSITAKKREKVNMDEVFRFDPPIKGEATWYNNRTLVFTPEERLPSGTKFVGTFYLGEVKRVKKAIRKFPLTFETQKQYVSMQGSSVSFYNQYSDKYMELNGSIRLNSTESIEDLERITSARIGDQFLKVKWEDHNHHDTRYLFHVDSILRAEHDQTLVFIINGKEIGAEQTVSREYMIKGLGQFDVTSINMEQEPEQKVIIHFSEYLKPSQDLSGLIQVEGVEDPTIHLSENVIQVFFKQRYAGKKKITIHGMIKNNFGYPLDESMERVLYFEAPKPQIKLVGKGNILPTSQGVYYPFETVALKAVDLRIFKIREKNVAQFLQVNSISGRNELKRVGTIIHESTIDLVENGGFDSMNWVRHSLDLGKLIKTEPGAIYRVMLSFKKSYTSFDCGDEETEYETPENELYYDYYGDRYSNINNYTPCDYSYYYGSSRTRNILVSDLGLMAKIGNDRELNAFVNDLLTAKSIAGVNVSVLDYTNRVIAIGKTDVNGNVHFKLDEDDQPYLLIASHQNERGYLKLADGLSNSLSKFEVEGARKQEGIDGFIYAERGVWRPGDSLYINFVLQDKQDVLPASHPVHFQLTDPRGSKVVKVVKTSSVNNVYDLRCATSTDAPTGTYRAQVTVGNQHFYKSLKVESVKPNRLKMDLKFANEMLKGYETNEGVFSSEWLHGAVANGLTADIEVVLNSTSRGFDGYNGYTFSDPTLSFSAARATISKPVLNDKGEAVIKANFEAASNAPGLLRADFLTKVFEKSGNYSVDKFTKYVSPFKNYVGLKVPKGSLEYGTLVTDESHPMDIATVNSEGEATDGRKVQIKVYKVQWRWWWNRNHDDLSSFIASNSAFPIVDTVVVSKDGKAQFNFRVMRPNWGRYYVSVQDVESGHSAGQIVYVDWPYWARKNRKQNENATMLTFSTDKKNYNKGERVKLTIPASTSGKALVCVENGYKIVKKFWVDVKKGENKTSFTTTADMTPNVYVHVTSILEHQETADGMPSRLFGVVPIRVEDPQTHLAPMISIADSIRPDQTNTVLVKEKDGMPMTYTLAIVDEGLLQLTGYQAPDPWDHFFRKQALGVKTWDVYDDVMGSFAGKWGNLLSVGGDGSAESSKSTKANRFKPVVHYVGPFNLKSGETAKHTFKIANYIGAVRVMVVAAEQNAYGTASKTVKVKKPLMVLATLPRVVSPGERINIPVNVFALNNDIKNVKVKVETNEFLALPEGNEKTMEFSAAGDEIIGFDAMVAERIGIAKVKVTVSSGSEIATTEVELDVRAPNPETSKSEEWVLDSGESIQTKITLFGLEGTNSVILEASTLPAINLKKRLRYLIQYPHGCVEQTTSSVFPQLALEQLTNVDENQKKQIATNINAGVKRLQRFQTGSGGFAYWPGHSYPSEWGSNYAGHFLLEAEARGYVWSDFRKNNWINYQTSKAEEWNTSSYYNNSDVIQAYRLYTLALAGKPAMAAMNRLREYHKLSTVARWRLAAAYGLAGRSDAASALVKGAKLTVDEYRELNNSFGSSLRDMAMILEAVTVCGDKKDASSLALKLAREMSKDRWMSTQETSYALLALSKYANVMKPSDDPTLLYSYNGGKNRTIKMDKYVKNVTLGLDQADGKTVKITNPSNGSIYIKLVRIGVPMKEDTSSQSEGVRISIKYMDLDGKPIDISSLTQGTQFVANVEIMNDGTRGYLEQMALMHMFPSGWEIHNSRLDGTWINESHYDYRDFRDDRVMTYFSLTGGAHVNYKVVLTATYQGRYYLPAVTVEAMYDHSIRALVPGKWIEVSAPPKLTLK